MKVMVILSLALLGAVSAGAQGGAGQGRANRQAQQGRGQAAADPGVTPAEIQRMFDAYALVQAQDQLQLADDQYGRFLARYKALQDIRRRALEERTRAVVELRRLLAAREADEAQLKTRMQTLADVENRAVADVRKAHDGVDDVLDTRQQAQFRVFEEQMERRKLELVTRARQANRAQ